MSSDKMREEFEAWIKVNWTDTYMARVPFEEGFGSAGNYWEAHVQMQWLAWEASRAAILVELPPTEYFGDSWSGEYAIKREDVVEAIEAAGLKVKP